MITMNNIIAAVCLATGFEYEEIVTPVQRYEVVMARSIAIHLGVKVAQLDQETVARSVCRDPSNVHSAIQRVKEEMDRDPTVRALVDEIEQSISFRKAHAQYREVDVVSVARHVASRPYRNAMQLSVVEIAALAESFLVLWEVGQAARQLSHLTCEYPAHKDPNVRQQVQALRSSICGTIEQMNPPVQEEAQL